MIRVKQAKLEANTFDISIHDHQSHGFSSFKRASKNTVGILKRFGEKKQRTEANDQECDQETLEKRAKTDLFEQSESHSHKLILKPYPKMKGQNQKKEAAIQNDYTITAFEDTLDPRGHSQIELMSQETNPNNKNKRGTLPSHSTLINQQVYWNKKRHPHIVLRPAVLNPVISAELSREQASLLNSPKLKNRRILNHFGKRKDAQALIKDFARKTKDIIFEYDSNKSKKTKQRSKNVISLSKRLVKLRSKSTNIIGQQSHKQLLCNEMEKIAEKWEFDLQIKCLNSQTEQAFNKKEQMKRHKQDLKERVRNLIIRQNKLADKKYSEVFLQGKSFESDCQIFIEDALKIENDRNKKLKDVHDRSKSCILTTFKGPQNKKLKITNILSKIAKYRSQQMENRRKKSVLRQTENARMNLQLIKNSRKTHDKEERKELQLVKISQQYCEQEARKSLVQSIKSFCQDRLDKVLLPGLAYPNAAPHNHCIHLLL